MRMILFYVILTSFFWAETDKEKSLNLFLDNWHRAAATADETAYFGSMDKDSVFIGTDATERWSKDVFQKWCQFAFDRESAWTFIPLERKIYFTEGNGTLAWFDETLDTWMGICRSSGVVVKVGNLWKIKHYHLSVTVPNELIKEFTDLVKQDPYVPVVIFDEKREADKDIAYAILQAKKMHKSILLVFGTESCEKCIDLDKFLANASRLKKYIEKHYVTLKINSSEKNQKLLNKYKVDTKKPYLVILDENANIVHSQSFDMLEILNSYDEKKFEKFLNISDK